MTVTSAIPGRVVRPRSLDEAIAASTERPDARIMGGGTLVVAERALGIDTPPAYLLLSGIPELQGVTRENRQGDDTAATGPARIGSMTTLRDLLDAAVSPMLDVALRSLASPQVRNRATVGGNIAERRPAHTLAPCLLALDASVGSTGPAGPRRRSIREFVAEGLGAGEIIVDVALPARGGFQRFVRVAPRNGPGYAIASVAVCIDPTARSVRSGIGGSGPTALAGTSADAFLADAIDWASGAAPAGAPEEFGRLLADACEPATDDRASAAYRRHAIAVMGRRLIEDWNATPHRGPE